MKIGVPKEVKNHEGRVGATPSCVIEYKKAVDCVFMVEKGAGKLSGYSDQQYIDAGAVIVDSAAEAYDADFVIKVKEPIESEFQYLKNQLIYTYLHTWSPDNKNLRNYLKTLNVLRNDHNVACKIIPYEEILVNGRRPCLEPMSAIAGKIAIQKGAQYLESPNGGNGVLINNLPGIEKCNITIIGAGIVGFNAAEAAYNLGASVTVLDINIDKLSAIDSFFHGKVETLICNERNLEIALYTASLVVGAVMVPNGKTPKVIRKDHLGLMIKNSLIVDVAIDEGGCVETSRVTTHESPIFVENGIRHYCVANMPAAVPRTATQALTAVTLPFGIEFVKNIKSFSYLTYNGYSRGPNNKFDYYCFYGSHE